MDASSPKTAAHAHFFIKDSITPADSPRRGIACSSSHGPHPGIAFGLRPLVTIQWRPVGRKDLSEKHQGAPKRPLVLPGKAGGLPATVAKGPSDQIPFPVQTRTLSAFWVADGK